MIDVRKLWRQAQRRCLVRCRPATAIYLAAAILAIAGAPSFAQTPCSSAALGEQQIRQAYQQKDWAAVLRLAEQDRDRSADADYDYGMALAHLGRWPAARTALLEGRRACPRQKRFPIELAGVAFEQKHYPEAAAWLRRGLKLDPHDEYANNFAGTVYYLMGNLPAALQSWNRIGKPAIGSLNFDPQLRIRRLLLDRAFTFAPASLLRESQFETTESRVDGLGIFSAHNIVLNARPDGSFDAQFHAIERDGFGAPLAAVVSTLSGLPYQTIYPSYDNIGRSAMNIESLLRWDSQKRRVWASLSAPLRDLPQHRWDFSADLRDENWAIRRSFVGAAPVLASLNLERQAGAASVHSFTSGRFNWSSGAEFSHRSYRDVVDGSALTSNLVIPGASLAFLASAGGKPLDIPAHRFVLTTSADSATGRLWSSPPHLFEKMQGSALAQWFPQAQVNTWEVTQRLRAGALLGTPPFDELFMLGVERDNDLWLRGHIGTRDGRKGSSPLGTRYLLANSDLYRRVYNNGLIGIAAGPLFDVGRMAAPTAGLSPNQWLFDTGIEARVTVLGTNVILAWGRDLRTGNNAFYGTAQ
ncbi:MAG TPA: bacterial transcriptional activator domain-containing protein [Acidobacteriaceae bacterium]